MKKLFFPLISLVIVAVVVIVSCNKNISVTNVTLNKSNLTLGVGETETLIASVLPEKAANKTVIWASSNILVATVMPNGLVTALTKGTTTIIATTVDGNYSASCTVKVDEISVTEVKLNKNTLILDVNETETLIATVLPENATIKEVYWTSNNFCAIVTNGLVTPIAVGKATITVSTLDGNKTAKCEVEVIRRVHVTGVSLNKTTLDLGIGNTELLIASVLPYNATNQNIIWSSSNSSIATVNNGSVTAKTEGTVTITATTEDGNFTATCEVRCMSYTLPVLSTLEPTIISIGSYEAIVKLSGNITDIGEPPYTERGFIYTLAPDDPLNPHPVGFGTTKVIVSGSGTGIFTTVEKVLQLDWNIRAYAKTSMGTAYGNIVTVSFDK